MNPNNLPWLLLLISIVPLMAMTMLEPQRDNIMRGLILIAAGMFGLVGMGSIWVIVS